MPYKCRNVFDIMGRGMRVSMKDYGIFATFLGRVAAEYSWRVRPGS